MRVKRAIGAHQSPLRGGQLTTAMHHGANGPQALDFGRNGADQIDAQLGGGVAPSNGHLAVHGAAHGRIQDGGIPTPMRGAHRVLVRQTGRPLKNGFAIFNMHHLKIQSPAHGGKRQAPLQHALHHFKTC